MTPQEASTILLVHFNEASGNFVDSSSAHHGLVKNVSSTGPSSSSSSKFGANCYQGPLSQIGTDGLLLCPSSTTNIPVPCTGVPYTIDLWVNIAILPISSSQALFYLGNGTSGVINLRVTASGKFQLVAGPGTSSRTTITGTTTLSLSTWHHLAVCHDGTTTNIFVDGVIDGSSTSISYPVPPTYFVGGVTIGYDDTSSGFVFTGKLDELRYVLNFALFTADFSASLPSGEYSNPPSISAKVLANSASTNKSVITLPNVNPIALITIPSLKDLVYGGKGTISGTVEEQSVPTDNFLHRRVRLSQDRDSIPIREVWSDKVTGTFSFSNIDETQKYSTIAYDYLHNYRAVVADNLTPVT